MANQVAARLGGDDYQHLYSWQLILRLKLPGSKVQVVSVENELAGSFDDVTIHHQNGANLPDEFHQVKYHVDQRSEYSSESFTDKKGNQSSLLEKFYRTWKAVKLQSADRPFHLNLISNWAWAESDSLRGFIEGHENRIKHALFDEGPTSKAGSARDNWRSHLKAEDADFKEFMLSLRLTLGFDCGAELAGRVAERMMFLGLEHDDAALKTSAGIVREWIMRGRQEITLNLLNEVLESHRLTKAAPENSAVVYLSTIKEKIFDIPPDHEINWRDRFDGPKFVRGHALKDGTSWNEDLLPELYAVEQKIGKEAGCKLIKARGFARLSPWFAFGHVFSEVSGYAVEVDQNDRYWRTDAAPSDDFEMLVAQPEGESLPGDPETIAIGLSITGSIEPRVREHLSVSPVASKLFLIQPNRGLGRDCLRSAGDAVAFARNTKRLIREIIESTGARRVLLFYFGPLSGACFLGHCLNAVGAPIQVMEDQSPGYAPSFILS
jgi:hypothetical protein